MSKINNSSPNLNKGFNKGYAVKKIVHNNNNNKTTLKDDETNSKSYPNGVIPFVTLLLFYVIFTIVVLSLGFTNDKIKSFFPWYWSTLSASVSYFLMNILWLIGRTGFTSMSGYMMMKLGRMTRLRKIRDKLDFYHDYEPAINEVNTMDEYNAYILIRKKYTEKFFYISLILSTSIMVINVIVSLSVYYAVYA